MPKQILGNQIAPRVTDTFLLDSLRTCTLSTSVLRTPVASTGVNLSVVLTYPLLRAKGLNLPCPPLDKKSQDRVLCLLIAKFTEQLPP